MRPPATGPCRLTEPASLAASLKPRLARVEAIANIAAGGVGPEAPAQLAALLGEYGLAANVRAPPTDELYAALRASVDAAPDLLVVLAGDGTARAAAEMSGVEGPPIAPLPGGTMNMLPNAIYGARPWPEALRLALEEGAPRPLGGGCIDDKRFLVAAILGSPALWASAREAARVGMFRLAWAQGRRALRRAFSQKLRYTLDSGERKKAEALVLMCPIASKVMRGDEPVLEAAALNVHGAAEALRLGLNAIARDWRVDPAVENETCHVAHVWSAHGLPALLDGELVRLPALTEVRYNPTVCRVLAPPKEAVA